MVDGPFAETKELIAGYWLLRDRSREEAIEWARKCPSPTPGGAGELEIRRVYEEEDFGPEFTPELREAEGRMRERLDNRRKS